MLPISRTKRIYNSPNKIFAVWNYDKGWIPLWHPYKEIYHQRDRWKLREERVTKWRRLFQKNELRKELKFHIQDII